MDQQALLKLIEEALDREDSIGDHDRVEGEQNAIGVTTTEGDVFFIIVENG